MRLTRILIAFALAASLAACEDVRDKLNDLPPPIFEDVGSDPHSPRLTLLGIGLQLPAPEPENPGDETEPPPVTYVPPSAGITVRPLDPNAKTLALRVSYADAGADLSSVNVRDLDGPNSGTLTLPQFPGIAGVIEGTLIFDSSSVAGPHRLEIWGEDQKESRSAKTSFTVTVAVF